MFQKGPGDLRVRFITLLLVLLTFSLQPGAEARTCLAFELQNLANREKLQKALAAVPTLRTQLLNVIDDPSFPRSIKAVIKKALLDQEIHIVDLTNEIRQKWNVDADTRAFVARPSGVATWTYKTSPETWNQSTAKSVKPEFNRPIGIAVGDAPSHVMGQQLVYLVHELAHVRFDSFLNVNLARICKKMTKAFCFRENGRWQMNRHLYDLLHEKYAHEMDFKLLHHTHGSYFEDWDPRWPPEMRGMSSEELSSVIGRRVAKVYGITDPHVLALVEEPISKVMLGSRVFKEADEAATLYSDPHLNRPGAEEFPIALAMIRLMRSADGDVVSRAIDIKKSAGDLQRLIESDNGKERLAQLTQKAFTRDTNTIAAKQALLDFVGEPGIRSIFNREGGWALPEKGVIRESDLIRGHPTTRVIFDNDAKARDENARMIQLLQARLFYKDEWLSQTADTSFQEAMHSASRFQRLRMREEEYQTAFRLPIRDAAHANTGMKLLKEDWKRVLQFWRRCGLENQFVRAYPNADTFWSSQESIIDLYKRLSK